MGRVADKLISLNAAKKALREAINAKGGALAISDPLSAYPTAIENLPSGGGLDPATLNRLNKVVFIDWDGTVLQTSYVEDGGSVVPPADPVRNGLAFSRWTHPAADFEVVPYDMVVGACYNAAQSDNGALQCILRVRVSDPAEAVKPYIVTTASSSRPAKVVFDWGDGNTQESNIIYGTAVPHTYAESGEYEILIYVKSGPVCRLSYIPLNAATNNQAIGLFLAGSVSSITNSAELKQLDSGLNYFGQVDGFGACTANMNLKTVLAFVDTTPAVNRSNFIFPYITDALFADNPDSVYTFTGSTAFTMDIFSAKCASTGTSNYATARRRVFRGPYANIFMNPGSVAIRTIILQNCSLSNYASLGAHASPGHYIKFLNQQISLTIPAPTAAILASGLCENYEEALAFYPSLSTTIQFRAKNTPQVVKKIGEILTPKGYTVIINP